MGTFGRLVFCVVGTQLVGKTQFFDRLKTKKRTGSGSLSCAKSKREFRFHKEKRVKRKEKERWSKLGYAALAAAARMYFMGERLLALPFDKFSIARKLHKCKLNISSFRLNIRWVSGCLFDGWKWAYATKIKRKVCRKRCLWKLNNRRQGTWQSVNIVYNEYIQ